METRYDDMAFPLVFDTTVCSGLTKREYFAAMAMQGLIQNQENTIGDISLGAVRVADALIEALNKEGGK